MLLIDSQILSFNKFCTYTFIIGNGILIPSQSNLGLIKFKGRNYAFSKLEYMKLFIENPEIYTKEFFKIIKMRPAFIIFFNLFDEMKNQKSERSLSTSTDEDETSRAFDRINQDQGIQTELHPIPYYKDYSYTWNLWDLRKRAIKLADIKKCKTHSAQTDISYHRINFNLQVDLPHRSTYTQTNVDHSTNTFKLDQLKLSNTM